MTSPSLKIVLAAMLAAILTLLSLHLVDVRLLFKKKFSRFEMRSLPIYTKIQAW